MVPAESAILGRDAGISAEFFWAAGWFTLRVRLRRQTGGDAPKQSLLDASDGMLGYARQHLAQIGVRVQVQDGFVQSCREDYSAVLPRRLYSSQTACSRVRRGIQRSEFGDSNFMHARTGVGFVATHWLFGKAR
jgi:hypothetical protein